MKFIHQLTKGECLWTFWESSGGPFNLVTLTSDFYFISVSSTPTHSHSQLIKCRRLVNGPRHQRPQTGYPSCVTFGRTRDGVSRYARYA